MSATKHRIIRESPAYSVKLKKKDQNRRERNCFWTMPFGHHYYEHTCVVCGKTEDLSY